MERHDRVAWKCYITDRERRRCAKMDRGARWRWRERERERVRPMVAMQERNASKKSLSTGISNRGTWRCTFRDLCAHLPSLVRRLREAAKENPFLSASMMSDRRRWRRRVETAVNRAVANYWFWLLLSSSMNNCYHVVRHSRWICVCRANSLSIGHVILRHQCR